MLKNHTKTQMSLLILIIVLLIYSIFVFMEKPSYNEANPFMMNDERPMLIAHGGGNQEFPDNTLEAYYNAYSVDPNVMMETDVSLTKDGILILTHDTTLDRRTTLIEADVHELNYEELLENEVDFSYYNQVQPRSNGYNVSGEFTRYKNYQGEEVTPLDVTYPDGIVARHETKFLVTTLEDLIKAFPNNKMNVEIKQQGDLGLKALEATVEILASLDDEYNTFERIVLASFHEEIYEAFVSLKETSHQELMISPQHQALTKYFILHHLRLTTFFSEPVEVFQVPPLEGRLNLATKHFIETAHKHDIAVHYWTINDEETMRELIELGADGIMTDRLHLLKEVLDDMYD